VDFTAVITQAPIKPRPLVSLLYKKDEILLLILFTIPAQSNSNILPCLVLPLTLKQPSEHQDEGF